MNLSELDFEYPEHLVATERVPESRVMVVELTRAGTGESAPREIAFDQVKDLFRAGDLLVINDTRVLSRRVFAESGLEILFLAPVPDRRSFKTSSAEAAPIGTTRGAAGGVARAGYADALSEVAAAELTTAPATSTATAKVAGATLWHVLCPSTRWKNGTKQILPDGVELELVERGRPQTVRASKPLTDEYFEKVGELPLPPYIQQARGERHNRAGDKAEYQTAWAEKNGSLAAPTASLHFSQKTLEELKAKGVEIARVTLHVGLGTFLPVTAENLDDHVMHAEFAEVPAATVKAIEAALEWRRLAHESEREPNRTTTQDQPAPRIWALGTTVTRTLESMALGKLGEKRSDGTYLGETDLFIRPGYEYRVVTALMTNFHQPKSTLVALVGAFAGLDTVKRCYRWAMEKEFRLFSYGDLSIWIRPS